MTLIRFFNQAFKHFYMLGKEKIAINFIKFVESLLGPLSNSKCHPKPFGTKILLLQVFQIIHITKTLFLVSLLYALVPVPIRFSIH